MVGTIFWYMGFVPRPSPSFPSFAVTVVQAEELGKGLTACSNCTASKQWEGSWVARVWGLG